ncbi:MAG: ribosome-associated translation inhibitor RaiA [Catalinimonas sp.]
MRLQINTVNFDASDDLTDFVQKKADKLDTFYDSIISGEAYLRNERDSDAKENKVVELKVYIPNHSLFAKHHAQSFEEATDLTVEALRRQLKKHKEKQNVR